MNRRLLAVALSLVVLLGLTDVPAQAAFQVRAKRSGGAFVFAPKAAHIAAPTRVTWRAVRGTHTVTATSSNWSKDAALPAGSRTSFRFRNAGTYRYRCLIHSSMAGGRCTGMCGRVVVH